MEKLEGMINNLYPILLFLLTLFLAAQIKSADMVSLIHPTRRSPSYWHEQTDEMREEAIAVGQSMHLP